MTLLCDATIVAAPLPARSYAAAALRSVKQSPALPDPLPISKDEEQSAHPAAADQMASAAAVAAAITPIAAASPASPMAWPAAPCPSPLAAAAAAASTAAESATGCSAADSEWTVAHDDAEMSAEGLDIDQCDFECNNNETDDSDEAHDSDWSADWSRVERLADALHSASTAGHSRKSRRAPPHSRTSTAALRAATSHSGALSAACAKAAPNRPSHNPRVTVPLLHQMTHRTGALPSPFAEEEAHEERMARDRMQRVLRARQNQQRSVVRSTANAAATPAPTPAASIPPASSAPRKGELRAAVTAARQLPLHLHRCDNPRWAAVLQARAATKQQTAQRRALTQRPPQMAKQSRPSKADDKADQKALRANVAAATRKQRRDEQSAKRQLCLKLRREAGQQPTVQSITATVIVTLAVTRWIAANPVRLTASSASASKSASQAQQKLQSPAQPTEQLHPRRSVVGSSNGTVSPKSAPGPNEFEVFRRRWYYAHRAHIESALPTKSILSIRLADPAPHVQSAFMALQRHSSQPGPSVTFHGTRPENLASILAHGFLRPGRVASAGKSVRVANGSSFGMGVYSSTTAPFSVSYCGGGSTMFVCATLMGKVATAQQQHQRSSRHRGGVIRAEGSVRVHGNIVVAFDERRIVPLFFLDFDLQHAYGHSSAAPVKRPLPKLPPGPKTDKQERALQRKIIERQLPVPPRPLLRVMLRALHSRGVHDGRQLKLSQLHSSCSQ